MSVGRLPATVRKVEATAYWGQGQIRGPLLEVEDRSHDLPARLEPSAVMDVAFETAWSGEDSECRAIVRAQAAGRWTESRPWLYNKGRHLKPGVYHYKLSELGFTPGDD